MSSIDEVNELLSTAETILQDDPTNVEALDLKQSMLELRSVLIAEAGVAAVPNAVSPAGPVIASPSASNPSSLTDTAPSSSAAAREWSVGDRVMSVWPEDGELYVARITAIPEPGRYSVLYLQYGNSGTVSAADLSPLTPPLSLQPGAIVAALWDDDGMFYKATVLATRPPAAGESLPVYTLRFSHTLTEADRSASDVYGPLTPDTAAAVIAPDSSSAQDSHEGDLALSAAALAPAPVSGLVSAAPTPTAPAVPALRPSAAAAAAAFAAAAAHDDDATAPAVSAPGTSASASAPGFNAITDADAGAGAGAEPYWPRDMPAIDPANPGAAQWVIPPRLLVTPADTEAEKRLKLFKTKKLKETFWRRVRELQDQRGVSSWRAFQAARPAATGGAGAGAGAGAAARGGSTPAAAFAGAGAHAGQARAPAAAAGATPAAAFSPATGATSSTTLAAAPSAAAGARPKLSLSAAVALKRRSIFSSSGPGVSGSAGVRRPAKVPRGPTGGDISGAWDADEGGN
jgi:hypothetical protein